MADLINDVRREAGHCIALRVAAEIERLQAAKRAALAIADERSRENVGLRKALKPFADFAPKNDKAPDNLVISQGSPMAARQLTVGDLRRAAAALSGHQ